MWVTARAHDDVLTQETIHCSRAFLIRGSLAVQRKRAVIDLLVREKMLTPEQKKEFAYAFIKPVALTWESQFRRGLISDEANSETKPPPGLLVGAVLTLSGTANGFALFFFSEQSSRLAAEEFQSRPLKPGGDPALGAINDVMRMVSSNASVLVRDTGQSAEIKIDKIFACEDFGLSGEEPWIGQTHLHSRTGATSIFGTDDVYVYVDITLAVDGRVDYASRLKEIVDRAEKPAIFASGVTAGASASAPPPLPVRGVDHPEEFDFLQTEILKARKLYVVDSEDRIRIALNARDDGSATVTMADKEGRMRATLAISNKGVSRMMFFDRYGRRIFVAPVKIKSDKEVRKRAMRMAERRMKQVESTIEAESAEERALIEAVTNNQE